MVGLRMLDRVGRNGFAPVTTDSSTYAVDALDARRPNSDIACPPGDLHHAFNKNQIASKSWLVDRLYETLGGRFHTVHILGGWYGVLGAMILEDPRFEIGQVISVDIDPLCAPVAEQVNAKSVARGRFRAITADAAKIGYDSPSGAMRSGGAALVINTSCEHMADTAAWYDRIPAGTLQVHQSNDYFDCPEHVNCVPDMRAFKAQLPMREVLYEGMLARRRYTRFMLIGVK